MCPLCTSCNETESLVGKSSTESSFAPGDKISAWLRLIWWFPEMGYPNSWMVYFRENPTKMDDN